MIYLTGDTHGSFERVEEFCEDAMTTREDVLVILGDVGINFFGVQHDRGMKESLAELPITLFCIHGNHEMRPEGIAVYKQAKWRGGKVYWEREFPNLIFAKDGEIYNLAGRRCIAIGGAYSVDKMDRKRGRDWWPDEQPSDEIKARVEDALIKAKWKVDAVFSHTCPYDYIPSDSFSVKRPPGTVDKSTEEWLGEIEARLHYQMWYCGHFHIDRVDGKVCFMYEEFRELW